MHHQIVFSFVICNDKVITTWGLVFQQWVDGMILNGHGVSFLGTSK